MNAAPSKGKQKQVNNLNVKAGSVYGGRGLFNPGVTGCTVNLNKEHATAHEARVTRLCTAKGSII